MKISLEYKSGKFTLDQCPKKHVIILVHKMNQYQNRQYVAIHELNVSYLLDLSHVWLLDDAENLAAPLTDDAENLVVPLTDDTILNVEIHHVLGDALVHAYTQNNKHANK